MRNTISVCYPLLCLLAVILLRRMLLFCTRSELIILLPECSVQSLEEAWWKILMKPCALWTQKDSRPTKENYTKYHTRKETCQVQSSIKELFSGSYMTIASWLALLGDFTLFPSNLLWHSLQNRKIFFGCPCLPAKTFSSELSYVFWWGKKTTHTYTRPKWVETKKILHFSAYHIYCLTTLGTLLRLCRTSWTTGLLLVNHFVKVTSN